MLHNPIPSGMSVEVSAHIVCALRALYNLGNVSIVTVREAHIQDARVRLLQPRLHVRGYIPKFGMGKILYKLY